MKRYLAILMLLILLPAAALAHPGGMDANQGHRDKDNISGLGAYHYHCNGSDAHIHVWGLCPLSQEYADYKAAMKELDALLQKYADPESVWGAEEQQALKTLLVSPSMPMGFPQDLFDHEEIAFGRFTENETVIREEAGSKYPRLGTGNAAIPILTRGQPDRGWQLITCWNGEKLLEGYVMADKLEAITLETYAAALYSFIGL